MKVKKFVDLTWDLTEQTPIYPGDPEPKIDVATTVEKDGYNLSGVYVGTQTGSHVDAPYHVNDSGETIENMELDYFFGEAVVVRVTDKKAAEEITMADVMPYDAKIKEGTIVLFNTNWYKKVGTEEFFDHPYLTAEVGEYLVKKGVRFIAMDTINVDQSVGTDFPVHNMFSEKRLMIGENWAYFDHIDFDNVVVAAFPMKIVGTDGSPVRAVAMEIE